MQNINNSSLLSMYISTFIEGTLFFALFIMLVEPKTSPVKKIPQIAFGIVFYLTWIILTNINVSNALIFSIFAANIYNFLQKFIENLIRIHFPKKVISPVLSTIQN